METTIQSGTYFRSQGQAKKATKGTAMKPYKIKQWVRAANCFGQQWVILSRQDHATWQLCQWVR